MFGAVWLKVKRALCLSVVYTGRPGMRGILSVFSGVVSLESTLFVLPEPVRLHV